MPGLAGFYLVGGTSLALQLGHRNCIDIDLFSQNNFTAIDIEDTLKGKHDFKVTVSRNNIVLGVVDNVKADFIRHDYPFILPPITEEGITYLSKEDIAAMKLHALIQSGKRLKDFIDIYFLLQYFTMDQLIAFFVKKYNYSNPLIALKAVTYFDDIDENTDPQNCCNRCLWLSSKSGYYMLHKSRIHILICCSLFCNTQFEEFDYRDSQS